MTQLALDPHEAARQEERAARERERNLARARAAAAQQRETDTARKIRELAADLRNKHPTCRCEFRGVRTREQLRELGAGCTDPLHACPRLDAIRRML